MTTLQIKQFLKEKPGYQKWGIRKLSKYLDVSPAKVAEAKGTARANKDDYDGYDQKENHNNDHSNRTNKSFTAAEDQTLEEYCESIGLDFSKIDPYNDVKYWTDGAGRRRYSVVPKSIEEIEQKEAILEAIRESVVPLEIPLYEGEASSNAGLINIYDAHIDKLSEVGEGHTIQDNLNLITHAVSKLYSWMEPHNIGKLYIPIGHDFFNTNGSDSVTKAGTPQQLNTHWKESFQLGIKGLTGIINAGLEIAQEVEIIPVEGNHDEDKVFYLNEVLKALYANSERVITTDVSKPMHHRQFGKNLLSFAHGKHEKKRLADLPLNVAEEVPELWGVTKYREMFLGDQHHKMEYRFLRKVDVKGYTVNYLRDISFNHSTWDRNNGYHLGLKSIESHIFSPEFGQFANFRETF